MSLTSPKIETNATSRLSPPKHYQWEFRPDRATEAKAIANRLQLHPIVAAILANRSFTISDQSLKDFLQPELSSMHDPFLMQDMRIAAERIALAVASGEKVMIFGDYDADGTTSTAVIVHLARLIKLNADWYVPHRTEEGYGLNAAAIEQFAADGVSLIITVDTGISAIDEVRIAGELGIDVVITDHHQPGDTLPDAHAVVDPSRKDCSYPNPGLTGVGVAFKVAHAVLKVLNHPPESARPFLKSLLDLVAIGAVADFAPLEGENRVMVSHGLVQLAQTTHPGLQALCRSLKIAAPITAHQLGFQIGPRLNAAGRTSHARICVELLTTSSIQIGENIVKQLELCNNERKKVESEIFTACMDLLETQVDLENHRVAVLHGIDWHPGVIGIVASRVMDRVARPVIILTESNGVVKGSARSGGHMNLYLALCACCEHLVAFGGHPQAAGMTLEASQVDAFRDAINRHALDLDHPVSVLPTLLIDAEVTCRNIDHSLLMQLRYLEPFGYKNPAPVLAARNLKCHGVARIVGNNHLKLQFRHEHAIFHAIGFNLGHFAEILNANPAQPLDVAFVPMLNEFWAEPRVEFEIKDIQLQMVD